MAERQGRILARLSELGLSLAEAAHERALAAETPKDLRDLTLAFHRISRSVRQSLALEARLERQRHATAKEVEREEAAAQRQAGVVSIAACGPIERRKDRVRGALNRLIWEEAERDEEEFEILTDDLRTRLDEAALREDFEEIPIEELILQLKADMGLEGDLRITPCAPPAPPTPAPDYPVGSEEWATGCPPKANSS